MVHIRRAGRDDAAEIAKVSVDSWLSTYRGIIPEKILKKITYKQRTTAFKNRLDDPQHYLFAAETADGQLVGFINGGRERSGGYPYDGEIYSLYILDEYHNLQIGRKLVRVMAERLLEDGHESLLVWVLEENPAKEFYKHLGAEPVDRKYLAELEAFETALGWTSLRKSLF